MSQPTLVGDNRSSKLYPIVCKRVFDPRRYLGERFPPTLPYFLTKEEKIEKLENYAEELKKELTTVEEQIKELKS